jgi:hypothetical protein
VASQLRGSESISFAFTFRALVFKMEKKGKENVPKGGSFSEHLAIESMGGRHTPIPLRFDAHGLKKTSFSLRN